MQLRTLFLALVALALAGTGVAVAAGGDDVREPRGAAVKLGGEERQDELARRIGVTRAKLDAALRDMALAEVDWARDAGFLTAAEADRLKERIRAGGRGRGFFGHGFGLGFRFGRGDGLLAAAEYLDLTVSELREALETKTLAQVAADEGKALDGLKQALRDATEQRLEDSRFTERQREALLERFDAQLDDVVNGRSPQLTELARRLGVDRAKVVTALREEAIAKIDRALADDGITEEEANDLKDRIRSAPGDGVAGKLGPGLGLGFGPGKLGGGPGGKCGPDGERRGFFKRGERPGRPGFFGSRGGELRAS